MHPYVALSQPIATHLEAQNSVECLYAVALIFPFIGTKGPKKVPA